MLPPFNPFGFSTTERYSNGIQGDPSLRSIRYRSGTSEIACREHCGSNSRAGKRPAPSKLGRVSPLSQPILRDIRHLTTSHGGVTPCFLAPEVRYPAYRAQLYVFALPDKK